MKDNLFMCGRYVSPDQAAIERAWGVHARDIKPFSQHYNVVPTFTVPILRLQDDSAALDIVQARWGLIPHWWKQDKPPRLTHNARSEEAASKPMWRHPLSKSRCLIPAVGWYEWKEIERADVRTGEIKKAKQPHFIHLPERELLCFAGLMSYWKAPEADNAEITCAILTQSAAKSVADVHDRMPIVLPEGVFASWLDRAMLDPADAIHFAKENAILDFKHYPVSDRINRPTSSEPSLLYPV